MTVSPAAIAPSSHQRVTHAIGLAARSTGVDFSYLLGQARLESGLNPAAAARTSSATGLFQFIDQTWLATVKQHGAGHGLGWASAAITRAPSGRYRIDDPGLRASVMALRKQPEAASNMAAAFAADNRAHLEARLGRKAEPVDLYLAHFLGAAGATRFLKAHAAAPDAAAAPLFARPAAANRSIFYARDGRPRSLDEIRQRFAVKLDTAGSGMSPTIAKPVRMVQPADYLRLAGASGHQPGQRAAPDQGAFAPTDSQPFGPMLDPSRIRLAYLLFAGLGPTA